VAKSHASQDVHAALCPHGGFFGCGLRRAPGDVRL